MDICQFHPPVLKRKTNGSKFMDFIFTFLYFSDKICLFDKSFVIKRFIVYFIKMVFFIRINFYLCYLVHKTAPSPKLKLIFTPSRRLLFALIGNHAQFVVWCPCLSITYVYFRQYSNPTIIMSKQLFY